MMTRPDGVSSHPCSEPSQTDTALGLWEITLQYAFQEKVNDSILDLIGVDKNKKILYPNFHKQLL
jgi:hypothetical protein